ncbi:uncharacterized protein B0T15DRAFT_310276 [Chaetomium strumarium]|uniref:Uncharacterized protein n=1 Tax=Chaetomium strumarium TaxID=1170767 RepID=A0AAJ0GMC5_9PEZI|nr:hypothetical protein B0T15DRAFT_310276 [Chaetomium strumarium]
MALDLNADILGTLDRSALLEFAAFLRIALPPPAAYTSPSPSQSNTAVLPQTWLDAQQSTITTLSSELLARGTVTTTAIAMLSHSFTRLFRSNHHHHHHHHSHLSSSPILGGMKLCPAHKKLDADLLTHCFALLAAEVSVRCDVLKGYLSSCRRRRLHHAHSHHHQNSETAAAAQARKELKRMVEVLSGVASLYLSSEQFERCFGSTKPKYTFQKVQSGCPACVLAVVGGRREVLVALRGNMLGRAKGKEPRLLRLVEAWMEMFGGGVGVEAAIRRESDVLAQEVRNVRRVMHERKVQRRARKGKEEEDGGKSRHRGGMPAGAKVVDGVPMPQVKVYGDHPPSHNYPAFGLDGARRSDDLPAARRDEETGQWDIWPSSVSSSCSSSTSVDSDAELNANREFLPARRHWPQTHRTTTQRNASRRESESIYSTAGAGAVDRPSSILRDAPRPSEYTDVRLDDDESVRIFLDQRQSQSQSRSTRSRRQSQQSTSTDWADFYLN